MVGTQRSHAAAKAAGDAAAARRASLIVEQAGRREPGPLEQELLGLVDEHVGAAVAAGPADEEVGPDEVGASPAVEREPTGDVGSSSGPSPLPPPAALPAAAPVKNRGGRPRLWSRDRILAALERFHAENGRPPATADFLTCEYLRSRSVIAREFSTVNGAVLAAGFTPTRARGGRRPLVAAPRPSADPERPVESDPEPQPAAGTPPANCWQPSRRLRAAARELLLALADEIQADEA